MASATDTARTNDATLRSRWLRVSQAPAHEPGSIFDLYWGGPERRITSITLRIIAVNTFALLILMLGILYMGQYQNSIIKARLETFESELHLISIALSEAKEVDNPDNKTSRDTAKAMIARLAQASAQRIYMFDRDGRLIADSNEIHPPAPSPITGKPSDEENFISIQILKEMANFVLKFTPDRRIFPNFPAQSINDASQQEDARDALTGKISLSVWQGTDSKIILTASAPLYSGETITGAVLLEKTARNLEKDIGKVWLNVLSVFAVTLILTILLSIYLSGVIARPLKKLAQAAEAIRKGQINAEDLPDYSKRHDEIGELSIALRQMTSALWARMDSIEQFAADVAHEIKNPLTSLKSAVETAAIVKREDDRNKLLGIIKHDVERLDRLITDISNASRLDAELSREATEKIDLKANLNQILDTLQPPLERTNNALPHWDKTISKDGVKITLGCAEDGNDIFITGIERRIGQVMLNLLNNALSFSPQGGTISIFVIPLKRRVSITIEDEGPGIPESKLESIFERFYSERPGHESFGKHSGLGLSICKQIIEAHGGHIFAENIKDPQGHTKGARFTVVLNRA